MLYKRIIQCQRIGRPLFTVAYRYNGTMRQDHVFINTKICKGYILELLTPNLNRTVTCSVSVDETKLWAKGTVTEEIDNSEPLNDKAITQIQRIIGNFIIIQERWITRYWQC